ncbi:membrane protein insertion efficiency factor YidD [Phenylobacterium sp.]|uniref:membrane protein insertion efficiency factor YidD n=1 Tax=Phenylobacterium sp. TaxID=1871053 RepID=UPI003D290F9A
MSFYERCVRGLLKAYKWTLSPLIGRSCRFAPTCSEYAAEALIGHGPVRGTVLTVRRLCRCHPWGGAGWDPPPPSPRRGAKGKLTRHKAEPMEGQAGARDWKCEEP